MQKLRLLSLLLCLLITSCSESNPDTLLLFNNHKFALQPGETVIQADSGIAATYKQRYNNEVTVQLPLYRFVRGKDYLLFIAAPFHASLDRIAESRNKVQADTVFSESHDRQQFHRYYRLGKKYCSEWVFAMDTASMICIFGETTERGIAETVLNPSEMKKRITQ